MTVHQVMVHGRALPPVPPFETGMELVARIAQMVRPPEHLTVSQWAQRHLGYDPSVMPWQVVVMDALSDPETAEVGLLGPAQQGKSEIGLSWLGWSIEHDPADLLICQPDKTMMQDFVVRRIQPMVDRTAALKERLLVDNIFLKQFRGSLLASVWPVASQFTARPIPRGWLDDYDQLPDDIDGQGSAVKLLDGRQTQFEGRDTKFVSSSPAREDGGGIEAFCAGGSDESLHPRCPSCGDRWQIDIRTDLKFEGKGSPDEAEASAHVVCGANGCILEPIERLKMIQDLANLPDAGFVAKHPEIRRRRGFSVDGLMGFTSWGKLAREWRQAQLAWESRQDESELRAFMNTRGGHNFRSQMAGARALKAEDFADRREKWRLGTVPPGAKVLVASVDNQIDRFEVAVWGYGDGLECWAIDRFAITVLEDGLTQIDPGHRAEHWLTLISQVLNRTYPLAMDGGQRVPILTMAVDTGGIDGASDNAAKMFRAAVEMGVHPNRITLIKGGNNPKGQPLPPPTYLDRKAKGQAIRTGPALFVPNVHLFKDVIAQRLRREASGPGFYHFPEDFDAVWFQELTAEERKNGKWEKIRARNETWDLAVYGYVAIYRPPYAGSRTHMRWVPQGFRVPEPREGAEPAPIDAAEESQSLRPPAAKPGKRKMPVRPRRSGGWMGRLK
ncbi:hypothetical protein BSL82_02340 [Tardibacter chloracetimidivorans]|uniref:Terminase n=1 Tax=Tardibacter chloracetimidivorans TaxID=1921510 RepID=A0A1L3ZRN2_9SPHN|nr:terminase gpA endonuclease subunit [Tardibacter chloracetimidivorans]API58286.1 hypothetical protein BSL82_02340 [Tardibacter chloracetimidivorans]